MSSAAPNWTYLSQARLRCAGFAFERIAEVGSPELVAAADGWARAAGALEEAEAALSAAAVSVHPVFGREVARRARRAPLSAAVVEELARGRDVQHLSALLGLHARAHGERMRARERLETATHKASVHARHALWAAAADPRFVEAVGILSPSAAQQLAPPDSSARGKKQRSWELLVWRFLQRLAAKNDTTSFFGPVVWGAVDGSRPTAAVLRPGLTRRVFFERWAICALAEAASADEEVRPFIAPRHSAHVSLEGQTLRHAGGELALDAETATVMALCDGSRSAEQVLEAARNAGLSAESALEELEGLVEARAVRWAIDIPTGEPHPEFRLADALSAMPNGPGLASSARAAGGAARRGGEGSVASKAGASAARGDRVRISVRTECAARRRRDVRRPLSFL